MNAKQKELDELMQLITTIARLPQSHIAEAFQSEFSQLDSLDDGDQAEPPRGGEDEELLSYYDDDEDDDDYARDVCIPRTGEL